jgi:hypothetical protein
MLEHSFNIAFGGVSRFPLEQVLPRGLRECSQFAKGISFNHCTCHLDYWFWFQIASLGKQDFLLFYKFRYIFNPLMNTYPAHIRNPTLSQMLWFMPVISATWEAQIKRIRSVPKVLRPHLNRKKFWCGSVPATVESLK